MSSEPTTKNITNCDQTMHKQHIIDNNTFTYNEYPLHKLKKMIISADNHSLENNSMDFSIFRNLTLNSMQLTYLPVNFAHHMTNLLSLDLSNNKLEELPHSFHQLTKLENLKIDNNFLTNLPNSFGKLKRLKSLSLATNKLTELPESFGCLFNLESLDLKNNKLKSLPISCSGLNKLSALIISDNELLEIPDCVTNGMKYLHELDVSNNLNIFINRAPASIHLTTFTAKNNSNCNYFPEWILWIKYNQLREVNLDNTTFRRFSFPKERAILQIKRLSMKQSNLTDYHVEEILSNMVKLETLDLSNDEPYERGGNCFWQTPFESIRVFYNLKEVNISSTSLPHMSDKISKFCNLVKLDLSYNRLSWLPKEFTKLQKLEVLYINHSGMIQLPDDIGQLKNLKELWASQNNISQLPPSLFDLKNLKLLDLYDNCISEVSKQISIMDNLKLLDLDQNVCQTSHLMIKNVNYNELKEGLRAYINDDVHNKRRNGVKCETFEHDEYNVHHFSDSSNDCSSISDDEEFVIEKVELPRRSYEPECMEEDWDAGDDENKTDNFVPTDTGLFRPPTNYYISAISHNNYYCPADYHTKPVRMILTEQNSLKMDKFEDGQFDDI